MGTGALFSYEKKLPYAVATVTPLAEGHAEAGVALVDWHGLGLKSASDNLPFTSIGTLDFPPSEGGATAAVVLQSG